MAAPALQCTVRKTRRHKWAIWRTLPVALVDRRRCAADAHPGEVVVWRRPVESFGTLAIAFLQAHHGEIGFRCVEGWGG